MKIKRHHPHSNTFSYFKCLSVRLSVTRSLKWPNTRVPWLRPNVQNVHSLLMSTPPLEEITLLFHYNYHWLIPFWQLIALSLLSITQNTHLQHRKLWAQCYCATENHRASNDRLVYRQLLWYMYCACSLNATSRLNSFYAAILNGKGDLKYETSVLAQFRAKFKTLKPVSLDTKG